MKGLLLLCFVFSSLIGHAQLDTIFNNLKYKPRLDARFDSRTSFITTQFARINGVKVNLNYNNALKIGLGYNWLSNSILRTEAGVEKKLKFRYFAPYIEYTFYHNKNWEITIPVQLGIGASRYVPVFASSAHKSPNSFTLVYEPYMSAQYRVLKYFAIGGGIGYRIIIIGNKAINENLNSPVYIVKAGILLGDLIKPILPKRM
jgi:hypothetical protein